MADQPTIDQLFQLAIAGEKAAERIYQGLERKFAPYPELGQFWARYASDEATHARRLEQIRARLAPEQLAQPADPRMVDQARKIAQTPVEDILKGVQNLGQAYDLAQTMEEGETNSIFAFLVSDFDVASQSRAFLQSQLHDHIARITDEFPAAFNLPSVRRSTRALD